MQFECRLGGLTGAAVVPVVRPAAAVAAAAFDQQTSREEDGVGGPQLLSQVYGVVARSAAVPLDVIIETVQINWTVRERGRGNESRELSFFFSTLLCCFWTTLYRDYFARSV